MYYKVWSKNGRDHLWAYDNFRAKTNSVLVDYKLNGNIIKFIIYQTSNPISQDIFDEFRFDYQIMEDYTPTQSHIQTKLNQLKQNEFNKTTNVSYEPVQYWWQKEKD